jgi:hypothetical protein
MWLQRVPDVELPVSGTTVEAGGVWPLQGEGTSMVKSRLGIISATLLGTWVVAVSSHRLEPLVELFPLMALVAGLVEVARKQNLARRLEL